LRRHDEEAWPILAVAAGQIYELYTNCSLEDELLAATSLKCDEEEALQDGFEAGT